MKAWW